MILSFVSMSLISRKSAPKLAGRSFKKALLVRIDFARPRLVLLVPFHNPTESLFQTNGRCPGKDVVRAPYIRPGGWDVAWMYRSVLDVSRLSHHFLNDLNNVHQYVGSVRTQIEGPVAYRSQGRDGASCYIVDVREIARLLAITKNGHRAGFADPLDEAEDAHVRPAGRSIDGEIAQNRNIQSVEAMVAIAESLSG